MSEATTSVGLAHRTWGIGWARSESTPFGVSAAEAVIGPWFNGTTRFTIGV
jgi:hypothetical protein